MPVLHWKSVTNSGTILHANLVNIGQQYFYIHYFIIKIFKYVNFVV